MSKKFSISMDERLCEKLDAIRKEQFASRSSIINQAVRDYIAAREINAMLGDFREAINRVSKNGVIDDDTKKLISDFEVASSLFDKYAR